MEKISTLIVDDEELARRRLKKLVAQEPDLELVGECAGGAEAVAVLRRETPQLVFLDIQMKEVNGFDVVERLAEGPPPAIVFVTAYDRYAVDAFDANAIDYLLKPFSDDRFKRAVERARRRIRENKIQDYSDRLLLLLQSYKQTGDAPPPDAPPSYTRRLVLKISGRLFFVETEEIDWIEAEGVYVRLHLGPKSHLLRESLSNLEQRLDPRRFMRIHRSTIINTERIKEIMPHFHGGAIAVLHDGTRLKISRSYRDRIGTVFARPG